MERNFNDKYIVNPEYILKPDKNRVILASRMSAGHSYCVYFHPMLAIMLSFFKGTDTLNETVRKISGCLGMEERKVIRIIAPFIDNDRSFALSYDGETFWFPEQVLVKNVKNMERTDIEAERFMIPPPYDFKTFRLTIPLRILFVLTTKCVTDCLYCYADKETKYVPMPLERALQLVDEAYEEGVEHFDLSGGEIFTYKGWDVLLKKIYEKGYDPYISTKVPLTEEEVDKLYELGTRNIQVSLDSVDPSLLEKTLKVAPDYGERIKKTIAYLDRKGFSITIKSTLTSDTCTLENLKQLMGFLKGFPNILRYTYTPVGYSHYKSVEAFNEFKPTMEQVIDMKELFEQEEESGCHIALRCDDGAVTDGAECACAEVFDKRTLCTGNVYAAVVLPDGKVTICEELYWNEHFILGDLMKNSLAEAWQSERAFSIWKLDRNRIPQESPCRECGEFDDCRYREGVCWKEVMAMYGKERWFYPDARCPKAPKPIFPVFYDNSFLAVK